MPTKSSTAEVAGAGIRTASGERKEQSKNSTATTIAVSPVRPPAAIPELVSAKVVTVEVPASPPPTVASASESMARFMLCFSLRRLVLEEVPISVPTVSKRSTRQKVMIRISAESQPIRKKVAKSNLKKVVSRKSETGGTQLAVSSALKGVSPIKGAPIQ